MASHSPQRPRKALVHSAVPGSMHNNLQARENSPSPTLRDRPRAIKTQSMPLVPAVVQMFAASNVNQQSQAQSQSGSTVSTTSRRSPPAGNQVQRLLPTPPHPTPPNVRDSSPDLRVSPPPSSNVNTHYPRPINRGQPAQFLSQYQTMDENWQMTAELLAEIERADLQQAQGQTQVQNPSQPPHPYPTSYPRPDSGSPPKDPLVERVRAAERSSPKEVESAQQRRQREQQQARESPKTRDRQPNSPAAPAFTNPSSNSPEQRISPTYNLENATNYSQYPRDSPNVLRRSVTQPDVRPPHPVSSQSPPSQSINRTPDRSLPVQEEAEDEPATTSKPPSTGRDRDSWKATEHQAPEQHHAGSPTPSSDLNPDGNNQRYENKHPHGGRDSRTGRRGDDDDSLVHHEEVDQHRSPDEEDGYTPRSPTAGLPDDPRDKYYPSQSNNMNMRNATIRGRTRTTATDSLGLRGLDPGVFDQVGQSQPTTTVDSRPSDRPPQYAEQRRGAPKPQAPTQQQQQSQPQHQQAPQAVVQPPPQTHQPQPHIQTHIQSQPQPQRLHELRGTIQHYPPYYASHPDDLQHFVDDPASAYIQTYLQSPRPDAPIPPTPHSQTAAPSPSPLLSGMFNNLGKDLPPFSPVAPVGSPYPYPFTHVRRNQSYSHPPRTQLSSSYDPNHPSVIHEQFARQWQVYAQNNNNGHMTDSTFSPSTTPFQGNPYDQWAFLHTARTLGGRMHDPMSMQSSPSHEPIPLPTPPSIGMRKKDGRKDLRTQALLRKPPPRVESTQPRETSPEPSSSGEETAGEEHFSVPEEASWVGQPTPVADDNSDWVDEDDPDDEDLLELEYHPSFVSNADKRRRKWEVGWEAITQAFETLDRQTDATMVVLAAPSHSTKLYALKSRSIRRQPTSPIGVHINELRSGFRKIATYRRNTRSQRSSLRDRFLPSLSSANGDLSDASSEYSEVELKRALDTALGSLGALGGIYEQREVRWIEEMRRLSEDRERVELLLRQALGPNFSPSLLRGP